MMQLFLMFLYLVISISLWGLFLSHNPIFSILFLVIICFLLSVYFLILGAEFLALILLIIYVGAIAILFLFSIMMFNVRIVTLYSSNHENSLGLFLSLLLLVFVEYNLIFNGYYALYIYPFSAGGGNWAVVLLNKGTSLQVLGEALYGPYLYTVLMAGTILLLALIGVISLVLDVSSITPKENIYKKNVEGVQFYNNLNIYLEGDRKKSKNYYYYW